MFHFCQETLDCLCELYELLMEEDMFVGVWQRRTHYPETNTALAYMQHGFFEQAQNTFEAVGIFVFLSKTFLHSGYRLY